MLHYELWGEITNLSPNLKRATIEAWECISDFTLLGMWLFIHASIKVNPW